MTQKSPIPSNPGGQMLTVGVAQFRAALETYPPADAEILEWLRGYLYQALGGQLPPLLAKLGCSATDLYRVFGGSATDQYSAVIAAAADLRRRVARELPLVETEVTRKITGALDYARDYAAMVAIVGGTGRGKTMTALHWAAQNNHGRTHYIRAGSDGSRKALLLELCQSAGVGSAGYNNSVLEQRIYRAYTSRNVIIIDEAGHLLPTGYGTKPGAIELLRDLHDKIGCAVVLIMTKCYLEQMQLGRMKNFYAQFLGRTEKTVLIDDQPGDDEIETIVRSFNPDADSELVAAAHALIKRDGGALRTLFRDFQKAALLAKTRAAALDAADLATAYEWRTGEAL